MTPPRRRTHTLTSLALIGAVSLLAGLPAAAHAASPTMRGTAPIAAPTLVSAADEIPIDVKIPSGTKEVFVIDAAITKPGRDTPITPGTKLEGYWAGVAPHGTWTVWLMPANIALGATAVGASGRASFAVTLPDDLATGDHWLEIAQPIGAAGAGRSSSQWLVRPPLPFTVTAAPSTQPPGGGNNVGGGSNTPPGSSSGGSGGATSGGGGGGTGAGGGTGGAIGGGTSAGAPGASGSGAIPASQEISGNNSSELTAATEEPTSYVYLSGLTTHYSSNVNPFTGNARIELTVHNAGTIPLNGKLHVWVTNMFGRTIGASHTSDSPEIAAGAALKFTVDVPQVGQEWMLSAHASYTPDIPEDATEIQKTQLAAVSREATIWAPPIVPLIGIAVIGGGGTLTYLLNRRRRTAAPAPTAGPAHTQGATA